MTSKKFKNFTDKAFTHAYDAVPYTFEPGETIFLEADKAEHFAKHLIDRVLNEKGIPTNVGVERNKLMELCFPTKEVVTPLEALQINETEKEVKAKKGKKKVEEEEFSDLNN